MAAQANRHFLAYDTENPINFDEASRALSVDTTKGSADYANLTDQQRYAFYDKQKIAPSPPHFGPAGSVRRSNQAHGSANYESPTSRSHGQHNSDYDSTTNTKSQSKNNQLAPLPRSSNSASHGAQRPPDRETDCDSWHKGQTTSDSGGDEQGLNEEEAPAPIQGSDRSSSWRREDTLESREKKSSAKAAHDPYKTRKSTFATKLYTASYLIFFAIWGTLARLGVQWLTFYPGAPVVISNLWANFAGTLLMGYLAEDQSLFKDEWGRGKRSHDGKSQAKLNEEEKAARKSAHGKVKKTIPLYVGLTVGFCGSFTSFSTFMRDTFFALANEVATPVNHPTDRSHASETVPRNAGYDFTALVAIVLLTLGMTFFALYAGAELALALQRSTPALPFHFVRKILDRIMVFLGFGCWFGAIVMTIWPPDRLGGPDGVMRGTSEHWRSEALFACCFAPAGCLLRYWASVKLNSLIPWFPLGTFAVNMFGTAVLAMCYDLQHVSIGGTVGGTLLGCGALQGIEDGFCGALTTVSTWIVELHSLRKRHAYLYGAASILVGFCLTVVIMGSVAWTIGFSSAICKTETS